MENNEIKTDLEQKLTEFSKGRDIDIQKDFPALAWNLAHDKRISGNQYKEIFNQWLKELLQTQ